MPDYANDGGRSAEADVTQLLHKISDGDREALDELVPIVYGKLRRLARMHLSSEYASPPLKTTELVHEAYFKLVRHHEVDWKNRSHFFAVASRAMRQILIEDARRRNAEKRGADVPKVPLEKAVVGDLRRPEELLALDEALSMLESIDERQSKIVEYRFFGGMTIDETAELLGISPSTVKRDWRTAKAWLYQKMHQML